MFHSVHTLVISFVLFASLYSAAGGDLPSRAIPIVVSAVAQTNQYRAGEPLLIEIAVSNGLATEIGFLRYSLTPNEWNNETFGVHVIEIYRDNHPGSIFLKQPKIRAHPVIAGAGRERILAGETKRRMIDLSKWEVKDGWKAGRYRVTVAVSSIDADSFTTLRVMSAPLEILIK